MPTLAPERMSLPWTENGSLSVFRTFSASSTASVGSSILALMRANSSPPNRATVSVLRMAACQPLGDRLKQQIADGMPQSVVDVLEMVEIEIEKGEGLTVPTGLGNLPTPALQRIPRGWGGRSKHRGAPAATTPPPKACVG